MIRLNEMMSRVLVGKRYHCFNKIMAVDDFIDGFEVYQGFYDNHKKFEALLKAHNIDCHPPKTSKTSGYFYCQQCIGPSNIQSTVMALKKVAVAIGDASKEYLDLDETPII